MDKVTGHYFIPFYTAGGGGGSALCNTGISAVYSAEITGAFSATQKKIGGWEYLDITGGNQGNQIWATGKWSSISGATAFLMSSTGSLEPGYIDVSAATAYMSYWPIMYQQVVWNTGENSATGTSNGAWYNSSQFTLAPDTTIYCVFKNSNYRTIKSVAVDAGGGSWPYPLRPTSESGTATASATSTKWATTSNQLNVMYSAASGPSSSYTTYSVNSAELGDVSLRSASLENTITGSYPATAYDITVDSYTINTRNASGSGWR